MLKKIWQPIEIDYILFDKETVLTESSMSPNEDYDNRWISFGD